MKTWDLIRSGEELLQSAGVPDAAYDARALFMAASGFSLADYLAHASEEASPEAEERFWAMLKRREDREPLQYITGEAPFYGRSFLVTPDVLIPRFDTEILVETALPHIKPGMRILDMCTGSGCVLITLLLEGPEEVRGEGSDISEAALTVARKNAEQLGARAVFISGNLFENIDGKYDIMTANPPYIETEEIQGLMREVSCHEPMAALDGGADGLAFYRRIAAEAGDYLLNGGRLFLEIGAGQAESVTGLLEEAGFTGCGLARDLEGRDRVVWGVWNV